MQTARTMPADVQRPGGLALTDLALGRCALASGARVLDVGCGTGAAVRHMRERYGYAAVGIDPDAARTDCMKGHAENLPVQGASFACVLCECVLSLVAEQKRVLQEIHRVLAPGGCLIISDIYDRSQPEQAPELLTRCGFTVDIWQDHTRSLQEYAAALTLRGQCCAKWLPPGFCGRHAGYYLTIARKEAG